MRKVAVTRTISYLNDDKTPATDGWGDPKHQFFTETSAGHEKEASCMCEKARTSASALDPALIAHVQVSAQVMLGDGDWLLFGSGPSSSVRFLRLTQRTPAHREFESDCDWDAGLKHHVNRIRHELCLTSANQHMWQFHDPVFRHGHQSLYFRRGMDSVDRAKQRLLLDHKSTEKEARVREGKEARAQGSREEHVVSDQTVWITSGDMHSRGSTKMNIPAVIIPHPSATTNYIFEHGCKLLPALTSFMDALATIANRRLSIVELETSILAFVDTLYAPLIRPLQNLVQSTSLMHLFQSREEVAHFITRLDRLDNHFLSNRISLEEEVAMENRRLEWLQDLQLRRASSVGVLDGRWFNITVRTGYWNAAKEITRLFNLVVDDTLVAEDVDWACVLLATVNHLSSSSTAKDRFISIPHASKWSMERLTSDETRTLHDLIE